MFRHAFALSIALMTFTPVALAGAEKCNCSEKCMAECHDGKAENCQCEDCGCNEGKCSHGKCSHEPKKKDKK